MKSGGKFVCECRENQLYGSCFWRYAQQLNNWKPLPLEIELHFSKMFSWWKTKEFWTIDYSHGWKCEWIEWSSAQRLPCFTLKWHFRDFSEIFLMVITCKPISLRWEKKLNEQFSTTEEKTFVGLHDILLFFSTTLSSKILFLKNQFSQKVSTFSFATKFYVKNSNLLNKLKLSEACFPVFWPDMTVERCYKHLKRIFWLILISEFLLDCHLINIFILGLIESWLQEE